MSEATNIPLEVRAIFIFTKQGSYRLSSCTRISKSVLPKRSKLKHWVNCNIRIGIKGEDYGDKPQNKKKEGNQEDINGLYSSPTSNCEDSKSLPQAHRRKNTLHTVAGETSSTSLLPVIVTLPDRLSIPDTQALLLYWLLPHPFRPGFFPDKADSSPSNTHLPCYTSLNRIYPSQTCKYVISS